MPTNRYIKNKKKASFVIQREQKRAEPGVRWHAGRNARARLREALKKDHLRLNPPNEE